MARQIGETFQQPSLAELEARIRGLESRLAHLTEVVDALAQGNGADMAD
ncbi:hypothetical protein [Microtetraspora fusca]|uniref:Uncharacterized protein n=1 Tax=Microtetraspora fusca TaxID=1997 RepID=A0ABW6VGF8_MICFU|nr:hypothetical protein [Microtetraspora fusca]